MKNVFKDNLIVDLSKCSMSNIEVENPRKKLKLFLDISNGNEKQKKATEENNSWHGMLKARCHILETELNVLSKSHGTGSKELNDFSDSEADPNYIPNEAEDEDEEYEDKNRNHIQKNVRSSSQRYSANSSIRVQYRRRKIVELPLMEHIGKLYDYLPKNRNNAVTCLKNKFSRDLWLELASVTLISTQLFNRRRAGEVERILIHDFKVFQGLDKSDQELFSSLSEEGKKMAERYVRFGIRGKLNRTVPVLLNDNLLE
ncbi:hypothetical protein JTB14_033317 [Gonioctena quinquepunctata]|nr:hypothetical protein JTB14_033317 [Gonioctena quinquepunctata]